MLQFMVSKRTRLDLVTEQEHHQLKCSFRYLLLTYLPPFSCLISFLLVLSLQNYLKQQIKRKPSCNDTIEFIESVSSENSLFDFRLFRRVPVDKFSMEI